ncbi:hypothetical protein HID58_047257 [Brassica napus]|uniref:26S proteasome non-ATPase regulatory subunit 3 N-terminal TPR repeats domain-containing protein n=1 Tax=Brassica napus TaxID=3708 RepID=A0ABQ8AYX5_BRANA|nr:hypothetical protein HID58_047257 [Brassica napus]
MWLFSASITRLNSLNKRTRDVIASILYVYYSLRYEMTGDLDDILTGDFVQATLATLCHDALGQVRFVKNVIKPRNSLFSFCFGYIFNVSFCECSKHF